MNHLKSILLVIFLSASSIAQANDIPLQESSKEGGVSSVPDLQFSLGFSLNSRESRDYFFLGYGDGGVIYNSNTFKAFVVDTRIFLSTFTDIPVLKDFGVSFYNTTDLGLEYENDSIMYNTFADHKVYNIGLWYKFCFDNFMFKPSILAVAGYGHLSHLKENEASPPDSLTCKYPFFGLEARFMPIEPWLRLFGRFDLLIYSTSWTGFLRYRDEINAGIHAQAGIEGYFLDYLYVGVVYDYIKFFNLGEHKFEYSEKYQAVIFRFGLSYR